jgi:hypothetical protein
MKMGQNLWKKAALPVVFTSLLFRGPYQGFNAPRRNSVCPTRRLAPESSLEARAVVDWARRTGAKAVIVPTEQFSSRRISWIFKRELLAEGVRVGIKVLSLTNTLSMTGGRKSRGSSPCKTR